MAQSSRENFNETRRRVLVERMFGGPGEWAANSATFVTEFWSRLWSAGGWPGSDRPWPWTPLNSVLMPGVDITEEDGELHVVIDMPEFSKDDIHARIIDNVLYVSAMRESTTDKPEAERVYWASRPRRFYRSIWLPVPLEQDAKISAKYENGALHVRLPIRRSASITIE